MSGRQLTIWAILLMGAFGYPIAVLVGGAPRFPSRSECVHPATSDGDLEVVFGHFTSASDANALLKRVLAVGFSGSKIEPDGCGLLKVDVHGIPTLKVGGEVLGEARSVGLRATVEQAG